MAELINSNTREFWGSKNLLPVDGEVYFFEDFLSRDFATEAFRNLHEEIPWNQTPIKIFGRLIMQPRLTSWHGDPASQYKYSGVALTPNPWSPSLTELRFLLFEKFQLAFNSVLLNLYRDGNDSMGWHRDNELELGSCPTIASISLGVERRFLLRNRAEKNLKVEVKTKSGSLLLMTGKTQEFWEHSIPKERKIESSRINLTFRNIVK